VIVVDKPSGWTSHDVVNKMRRIAATTRVGHLGTLDPMATGVLPLVVGRATRLAQFYTKNDKVYDAVIQFGRATTTFDAEGDPLAEEVPYTVERDELERLLAPFRGNIQQVPPPISAKKIGGRPAYELVRKNIEVTLKPMEVTIHSAEILECSGNSARIKVHCSPGTYLRRIAHDIGIAAGCGAHLARLVRLRSGEFTLAQSRTLEKLMEMAKEEKLEEALVPAADLMPEWPVEVVDEETAGNIRNGRDFRVSPFRVSRGAKHVKVVTEDGYLLAIGELKLPHLYHPMMVL
jgi:tRNA pseudouridine55 synthase